MFSRRVFWLGRYFVQLSWDWTGWEVTQSSGYTFHDYASIAQVTSPQGDKGVSLTLGPLWVMTTKVEK